MFCTNCGKRLEPGALFCGDCGTRAERPEAEDFSDGEHTAELDYDLETPAEPANPEPDYTLRSEASAVPQDEAFAAPQRETFTAPWGEMFAETRGEAGRAYAELSRRDEYGGKGVAGEIARTAASILLCAVLAVFLLAGGAAFFVRSAVLSAPDAIGDAGTSAPAGGAGLADAIFEALDDSFVKTYDVSKKSIEKLLRSKSVKRSVSELASDYIQAIKAGNLSYHITEKKILEMLDDNASAIESALGFSISGGEDAFLDRYHIDAEALGEYSVGALLLETQIPLWLPTLLLSPFPVLIAALLCALIAFDVFIINAKRTRRAFLLIGSTAGVMGMAFSALAALVGIIFEKTGRGYIQDLPGFDMRLKLLYMGVTLLGAGIACVLAYIIIRRVRKERPAAGGLSFVAKIVAGGVNALLLLAIAGMCFFGRMIIPEVLHVQTPMLSAAQTPNSPVARAPIPTSTSTPASPAPVTPAYATPTLSASPTPAPTVYREPEREETPAPPVVVSGVLASSTLAPQRLSSGAMARYDAENICDGDINTVWCEGAGGHGTGEYVIVTFARAATIYGMYINNGYWRDGDSLTNNSRIKQMRVNFGDGSHELFSLADPAVQSVPALGEYISFAEPHTGSLVTITIVDAYPGAKWEDACVSEISFSTTIDA
jgi:hypothetical protein